MEQSELKTSLLLIEQNQTKLFENFYSILLKDAAIKKLFINVEMRPQYKAVFNAIKDIVEGLNQPTALQEMLINLGSRHNDYGVSYKQYKIFQTSFIEAAHITLGTAWTKKFDQNWNELFEFITNTMLEGAESAWSEAA